MPCEFWSMMWCIPSQNISKEKIQTWHVFSVMVLLMSSYGTTVVFFVGWCPKVQAIYIYIDVSMYNIPTITLTQHVRFNPLKIQLQAAGKRVIRHTLTHVLQEIHDDTYDRVTILPYEWQTVGIIWNYMVSNHTNTISSAIVLDFCWHKIHIATPTLFSHISVRLLLQWSWWIQPRILIHSLSNQNKHNIISPFLVSHCLRWFGDSPSNTTSS